MTGQDGIEYHWDAALTCGKTTVILEMTQIPDCFKHPELFQSSYGAARERLERRQYAASFTKEGYTTILHYSLFFEEKRACEVNLVT